MPAFDLFKLLNLKNLVRPEYDHQEETIPAGQEPGCVVCQSPSTQRHVVSEMTFAWRLWYNTCGSAHCNEAALGTAGKILFSRLLLPVIDWLLEKARDPAFLARMIGLLAGGKGKP